MDLIKIGKYIAGKRKALGMTQRQLAEKLGMSDKSISKWERGVCLPDVSLYADLCLILGIGIHEFLAGEDIPQENILQKSEENIIGVTADSKRKQNILRTVIYGLLAVSVLALSVIGIAVYREVRPQNFIAPVARDSIEMQTAELLSGPDSVHIYRFTATDDYQRFRLYFSEYHAGELVGKENLEIGFDGIGSPESGEILIVPDFKDCTIKVVMAAEGARYSTEIPVLEDAAEKERYGRSSTGIRENTAISYNREQALAAFVYDDDQMRVLDLQSIMDGITDPLAENDYVYYFSFEFCKE